MGSDREVPGAREMCSGVRSILGSLCRSADVQLWIDEEHAPRQRKVVKAFEQKLGGLDSNGEVAVVDRGQRKVTDPGKVGVVDLARWISGLDPVEVYATGTAIAEPRLADHGDVDTSVATLRLQAERSCRSTARGASATAMTNALRCWAPVA
jgi:hypothetical protein